MDELFANFDSFKYGYLCSLHANKSSDTRIHAVSAEGACLGAKVAPCLGPARLSPVVMATEASLSIVSQLEHGLPR